MLSNFRSTTACPADGSTPNKNSVWPHKLAPRPITSPKKPAVKNDSGDVPTRPRSLRNSPGRPKTQVHGSTPASFVRPPPALPSDLPPSVASISALPAGGTAARSPASAASSRSESAALRATFDARPCEARREAGGRGPGPRKAAGEADGAAAGGEAAGKPLQRKLLASAGSALQRASASTTTPSSIEGHRSRRACRLRCRISDSRRQREHGAAPTHAPSIPTAPTTHLPNRPETMPQTA
mmetsp:Transcript_62643/g.161697  ORF Transcript_62643/g.161697 Transcript_62643/m.161697 type:complete len:240 (-) Transcript_62643:1-720(-)